MGGPGGGELSDFIRIVQHNRPGGTVQRHRASNVAEKQVAGAKRRVQLAADERERAMELAGEQQRMRRERRQRGAAFILEPGVGGVATGTKLLGL